MLTKIHIVKAMVLPVVMNGCEIWTINNTEHRKIDAFELWCWRRLSRVPCIARTSNQSLLKEINNDYSLEGLMLRKTEGKRRRHWQRMRWLDSISGSIGMKLRKFGERVEDRGAWHATVRVHKRLDTTGKQPPERSSRTVLYEGFKSPHSCAALH